MSKRVSFVTVGVFFGLLLFFAVFFWALPDRSFSETEKRSLCSLPRCSVRRLLSGDFAEDVNRYFADQFPLRERLVELKASCELALGRGENDGILLGRNGTLARRCFAVRRADGACCLSSDHYDRALLAASKEGILRASEAIDVPFSVCFTGRAIDVNADSFSYPDTYSRKLLAALREDPALCACCVDTVDMLRRRAAAGEEVYYRTDHHWTMLGAYYAYAELLRSWGMEDAILPLEAFQRECATERFYGTAHAAAGWRHVSPDRLELWHCDNEDVFSVVADGAAMDGFYNRAYLSTNDPYSTYLDGVHERVFIQKKGEARERLVIFKDSFANSIAPFLAQHFDLVLLNLSSVRTDYSDLSRYAAEYGADRVLVLYTLENVITADTVAKFR